MSIHIHPECRKRLIEFLSITLPKLEVTWNNLLDYQTTDILLKLDDILTDAKITKQLKQYIGERPLYSFTTDIITEILYENYYNEDHQANVLTDLPEFRDPQLLAEKIITELETLPWEYTFFVRVPFDFSKKFIGLLNGAEYKFTDTFSLIHPSDELKNDFPFSLKHHYNMIKYLGSDPPSIKGWPDYLYFKYKTYGFVNNYSKNPTVFDFKLTIRSFLGINLALSSIKIANTFWINPPDETIIVIYQNNGKKWTPKHCHNFNADFSLAYQKIELFINDNGHDGNLTTENCFSILDKLRNNYSSAKAEETILKASQWFFDSYCGNNELLSFIQSMVVLEILLGDKKISDSIGLGELLRNRCAYLIGESSKERENIINDFDRIYNSRSRIVHEGKNQLSENDIKDLNKLRKFCSRVIEKELQLLVADDEYDIN